MRIVIQRVNHASVKVDGETIGSIGKGYLLLLGVAEGDTKEMVDRYVKKLSTLRIFADEEGKTNLSITDVGGEVLVVSQFTLYADCKKGNRPSFVKAGAPDFAEEMYEYFKAKCVETFGKVECRYEGRAGERWSIHNLVGQRYLVRRHPYGRIL